MPAAAMEFDLRVTPISFQALAEDENEDDRIGSRESRKQIPEMSKSSSGGRFQSEPLSCNFSMRRSYPAIIFEGVCFSVNKSQQQANFFNECLCKTKQCFALGFSTEVEKKVDILKSINLNVPSGCIFGLLGPSSCGKTTLLRCLVGLLKPSFGSIRLFCQETRTFGIKSQTKCCFFNGKQKYDENRSKVPGPNVGYMPQDLGLYEDFTIRQLLTMFGQYVGMESSLIKSRIKFMVEFLDLPEVDREIISLSGGQKRRVSFAIACLHMPPLIILDEPTVGVDPLLRQSIWKYLRRLADEENKTIIITTHYIEEAAQADQVALMRAGEILIQDAPKRIMQSNNCKTLEEAFLRICSNKVATSSSSPSSSSSGANDDVKKESATEHQLMNGNYNDTHLRPSRNAKFDLHDKIRYDLNDIMEKRRQLVEGQQRESTINYGTDAIVKRLQEKAQEKLAMFEYLQSKQAATKTNLVDEIDSESSERKSDRFESRTFSNVISELKRKELSFDNLINSKFEENNSLRDETKKKNIRCLRRCKLVISDNHQKANLNRIRQESYEINNEEIKELKQIETFSDGLRKSSRLMWALLYKNYRRNVNSLPLLAFQFMLPIIQMISFSLCVGGRPTQIGLGLVNNDRLFITSYEPSNEFMNETLANSFELSTDRWLNESELLSTRYLSFLDESMLSIRDYSSLSDALRDVRRGKLWAAMEIGANFTSSISKRFDMDNFYQLNLETIRESVIKIYPDRSNKVLDMICHRSLVNSYRKFLIDEFEHFKQLPIEVKEPIFEIKPNLISNSMDGYTESIAAGLLASLTYIMAAGLTTFIMVVERSAGILERTFTSGISPIAYLMAHAIFRSFVMMLQIGLVLFLTFYLLQQPLVGSIWLAYLMLMILNLTGIAYGLLISSLVTDQNGAALTIVSSLVVKITMSGILWPFEAIPRWLRAICYVQPLTMPVQALKSITLKGSTIEDRAVYLGFVVSLSWLVVFLTISARRFKFYQH